MFSTLFRSPVMNRRMFLRGAGVALALPYLEAMRPRLAFTAEPESPQRMVFLCASLGIHAGSLFPQTPGDGYETTPYLDHLRDHRGDYSILAGLSHPEQSGADGHSSEMSFLTGARRPGLGGFRNTISVDQLAAEKLGAVTRFSSLQLGTSWTSQSYSRSGVMIGAEPRPSHLFAKMFLAGSQHEVEQQVRALDQGGSILDTVRDETRSLQTRAGTGDRHQLDEYLTSIRELEQRMTAAKSWLHKPKPTVDASQPSDITNESDLIGRMKLLMGLIPLALQTDSTRIITVLVQGRNDVPPVAGVSADHHNLSHHGQDPDKLRQLQLIETEEMKTFAGLIAALKAKTEGSRRLLDNTQVMFGSNLGNANSHDATNLPLILAGGNYRHGRFHQFDKDNNIPLSNLYVQMLRQANIEVDQFGTSTKPAVPGLARS